jgi:Tfp pilus assembly protein PilP
MSKRARHGLLTLVAVALLGLPGFAQEAAPKPTATPAAGGAPAAAPGAESTTATAPATETREPLDVEMDTGGYSYNSQGRRDPFVSLQRRLEPEKGPGTRPRGMEGFLIQEVALKGIVKTSGGGLGIAKNPGYIAIFQGPTGSSYFVTTGQRLYDGVITAVDATSVTFRQDVTDPLSPVKSRDVRKSLYASEEARQ